MSIQPLTWAALASAAFIFALRVVDVSIATVRMLAIIRGQRLFAWVLGFFQALVFVLAIRQIFANLNNVWNMLGYAAGFATGTVVGMWLEERLAMGYSHMRVISPGRGAVLAERLREAGFAVTEVAGRGRDGTVDVLNLTVPRKRVPEVRRLVTDFDPKAFITVEDVRPLRRGYFRA